jgi:hypothetical protein
MAVSLFVMIAVVGGGFGLALRFVRAFERRSIDQREVAELRAKVGTLEDNLESMTHQVSRIAEAQQFTTRLLGERSESPPSE